MRNTPKQSYTKDLKLKANRVLKLSADYQVKPGNKEALDLVRKLDLFLDLKMRILLGDLGNLADNEGISTESIASYLDELEIYACRYFLYRAHKITCNKFSCD